jgi:hypothetical protein
LPKPFSTEPEELEVMTWSIVLLEPFLVLLYAVDMLKRQIELGWFLSKRRCRSFTGVLFKGGRKNAKARDLLYNKILQ